MAWCPSWLRSHYLCTLYMYSSSVKLGSAFLNLWEGVLVHRRSLHVFVPDSMPFWDATHSISTPTKCTAIFKYAIYQSSWEVYIVDIEIVQHNKFKFCHSRLRHHTTADHLLSIVIREGLPWKLEHSEELRVGIRSKTPKRRRSVIHSSGLGKHTFKATFSLVCNPFLCHFTHTTVTRQMWPRVRYGSLQNLRSASARFYSQRLVAIRHLESSLNVACWSVFTAPPWWRPPVPQTNTKALQSSAKNTTSIQLQLQFIF